MEINSLQGQYSGFLSRLMAFFIDVIIIALTDLVVYLLIYAIFLQFVGISINRCPNVETFNLKIITCNVASWGLRVFMAGFPLVYMLFFWILIGQTLGDYAAGVRVVRMDGHRLTLISSSVRLFGYFLCFISLGLGFLWILVDDRRQGWHDKLARTYVIYSWEARQDVGLIDKLNQRLFKKPQQT